MMLFFQQKKKREYKGKMKSNKEPKEPIIVYIVMGIYLLFLCWTILFKLADGFSKIPSMRSINLIPFYYDTLSDTQIHLKEVVYNVFIFIPAGFYLPALRSKKIKEGIIGSFFLSLFFEIMQWIFALGASDITDVITNTMGGLLGACLYVFLGKIFKGKQVLIVSIIGAVLEALLVCLLVILFIVNS